MENFLIIRLSSLGDIIHTLPAFSAIRKNFPKAKISWLVEGKGKEILECVPGLDEIVVIKREDLDILKLRFWKNISKLRKKIENKHATALDFQGLLKSGLFAYLSRAKRRIGFHRKNLKEPLASLFYTEHIKEIPEGIHVIYKNLMLLTHVGLKSEEITFPLLIPSESLESLRIKLENTGYDFQKKLVVCNVGASWQTKRWFGERWVKLIKTIKKEGLFILVLWGNKEERELAEEVSEKAKVPLSPFLTLKEMLALVKNASLLVSGDTLALQVACAFTRPVVGLFGPTNPRRNGPFRAEDQVAFHELSCSYCYRRKCSSLECMSLITVEEVSSLCLRLLEKNALL